MNITDPIGGVSLGEVITHISVERAIADMTRDNIGEGGDKEGIITINIEQADALAGLLMETYGFLLNVPRGGGEIADQIACLAVALKGKDA